MDDQPPPPPKKKGGRPRLPEHQQGCVVSTYLPSSEYTAIIQKASQYNVTVSKLVRIWVRQEIRQLKS